MHVCARACVHVCARACARARVCEWVCLARACAVFVRACLCVRVCACVRARAALRQCLAEELDGQRHMLGRYGTREAIER